MKTRAAVCRAFAAPLSVETIDVADPGPGEVRIRTAACAICHSDIFYIDGAWGGDLPAVYGHEAAGVVEAVGPGVTRLGPGDRVVATLIRNCGFCPACAEGAPVFCEEVFPLDRRTPLRDAGGEPLVHGLRTGAFAEAMVVDASQAVAIPEDVSARRRLADRLRRADRPRRGRQHRRRQGRGRASSSIGCGGVGLNSVQGARLAGCDPIIAVDVAPAKLDAARAFGATHTIDAEAEDVEDRVKALTARPQGRLGVRDGRGQGRRRAGRVRLMKRGGGDGARRHAALRRPRDDRSRLARRRRAEDSRLEDGLGAPRRRRAEDRVALSRRDG